MKNGSLGLDSSRLVSTPAIVLWLCGSLACAWADLLRPAGLLLFIAVTAIVSRIWGRHAIDRVGISLVCGNTAMFPGAETGLSFRVSNEKALPLVWLELSMNAAEKDCFIPAEGFERYVCHSALVPGSDVDCWRRGFSYVRPFEEIELETRWTAVRRGVYCPSLLLARSGDGFGLSRLETLLPRELLPEIVVYPRLVPVDIAPLIRYSWELNTGSRGFMEDNTVIAGLRRYTPADSWKHMNWRRLAAGEDELQVNRYETVRPLSAMFVFDGESTADDDALERGLELLGSLIAALSDAGIPCGLCLPAGADSAPVTLPLCEERSAPELLARLAAYNPRRVAERNADGSFTGRNVPSSFDYPALSFAANGAGFVYVFTGDITMLPAQLTHVCEKRKLVMFTPTGTEHAGEGINVLSEAVVRK